MKKVSLIFVLFLLGGCLLLAFVATRAADTAVNLAAEELQRPPTSSEVIAESLERRTAEEEGRGFLAYFGLFALVASGVGAYLFFYRFKSEYLRQQRLTTREAKRAPRIRSTIPAARQLEDGLDHERSNHY